MSESLRTERLLLREPRETDGPALLAYYLRNEERFAPWEPDRVDSIEHHARWIAWRRSESAIGRGRSFLAFDRATDALAVVVNLYQIDHGASHSATLGYSGDGAFEGQGYAREAVQAVITHAFTVLHLHRINANYQPTNVRSAGLLKRLGFVEEGYARDMLYLRGSFRDHVLTSLVNPNWTPPAG
ncbi:MAG TPA: GNAT family N-acetyltransferase [Candidatus Elarobacter sp.]|nr:GNAT family N-acetyltransferase [Candidatus Elarobacter sp.]